MSRYKERIPGGTARHMRPSDFDEDELLRGTQVEMEHTRNREVAREIAMDHLAERPDYYDLLERLESSPAGRERNPIERWPRWPSDPQGRPAVIHQVQSDHWLDNDWILEAADPGDGLGPALLGLEGGGRIEYEALAISEGASVVSVRLLRGSASARFRLAQDLMPKQGAGGVFMSSDALAVIAAHWNLWTMPMALVSRFIADIESSGHAAIGPLRAELRGSDVILHGLAWAWLREPLEAHGAFQGLSAEGVTRNRLSEDVLALGELAMADLLDGHVRLRNPRRRGDTVKIPRSEIMRRSGSHAPPKDPIDPAELEELNRYRRAEGRRPIDPAAGWTGEEITAMLDKMIRDRRSRNPEVM